MPLICHLEGVSSTLQLGTLPSDSEKPPWRLHALDLRPQGWWRQCCQWLLLLHPSLPISCPFHLSLQAFPKMALLKRHTRCLPSCLRPLLSSTRFLLHSRAHGKLRRGAVGKALQVSPTLAPGRRSSGGAVFQVRSSAWRCPPCVLHSPPRHLFTSACSSNDQGAPWEASPRNRGQGGPG